MDDATYIRGLTLINPTDQVSKKHNERLNEIADRLARLDIKPDVDLTEIRSKRSNNSTYASPRGILQRALDLIRDEKWNPNIMVIIGSVTDKGVSDEQYFIASPDFLQTIGLLESVKWDIMKDASSK